MTSRCFQDADKMFSFVVDFCLNPIPPSDMKISPNRQFRKCVLLTSMPRLKDTVPIPECRTVGIVRSNLHMYLNPRMSHDMQMRETTSLLCSLSRSSISSDPCILYICGISTGRLSFYSWLYLCGSTFDRSCGKWQKRKYCVMCLDSLVEPKLNSQ